MGRVLGDCQCALGDQPVHQPDRTPNDHCCEGPAIRRHVVPKCSSKQEGQCWAHCGSSDEQRCECSNRQVDRVERGTLLARPASLQPAGPPQRNHQKRGADDDEGQCLREGGVRGIPRVCTRAEHAPEQLCGAYTDDDVETVEQGILEELPHITGTERPLRMCESPCYQGDEGDQGS